MNPGELIKVADAPPLPGLTFRRFRDESDYSLFVELINVCNRFDRIDQVETLEHLTNFLASLEAFDPYRDLLLVEMAGQVIGYSEMAWLTDIHQVQFYLHSSYLLPEWRGRGLGRALLGYNEGHLQAIAATQPPALSRLFEVTLADTEPAREKLLRRAGYQPGRYFYQMKRPLAQEIPPAPLPPGLELRPVQADHFRAIWEAMDEAFRDHWSHIAGTENDYQAWLTKPNFEPALWQVAWAGEHVAGSALNLIDADGNVQLGFQRGEVKSLSVRRPWRRQGLARALLARSLETFKARGMVEVILYVDTENESGALGLYKGLGFEIAKQFTTYHKPLA